MEAIEQRTGKPQKGDDIILTVIGDGRKSAIDMRLVDPSHDLESTKLERLIDNVYKVWEETKKQPFYEIKPDGYSAQPASHGPATQMVFSSLGVSDAMDFNVHRYIRDSSSSAACRRTRSSCSTRSRRRRQAEGVQRHERRQGPHPDRLGRQDGDGRQRAAPPLRQSQPRPGVAAVERRAAQRPHHPAGQHQPRDPHLRLCDQGHLRRADVGHHGPQGSLHRGLLPRRPDAAHDRGPGRGLDLRAGQGARRQGSAHPRAREAKLELEKEIRRRNAHDQEQATAKRKAVYLKAEAEAERARLALERRTPPRSRASRATRSRRCSTARVRRPAGVPGSARRGAQGGHAARGINNVGKIGGLDLALLVSDEERTSSTRTTAPRRAPTVRSVDPALLLANDPQAVEARYIELSRDQHGGFGAGGARQARAPAGDTKARIAQLDKQQREFEERAATSSPMRAAEDPRASGAPTTA
jgi:hypothetical protein